MFIRTRKINIWLCCKYHFLSFERDAGHFFSMLGFAIALPATLAQVKETISKRLITFPFVSVLAASFTVMCYNVLCDKYATRQLYGYCPSWALNWEYRKKGIMEEIVNCDADIISLQVIKNNCIFHQKQKARSSTFRAKCSLGNTMVTCSIANSGSSQYKLCIPYSRVKNTRCSLLPFKIHLSLCLWEGFQEMQECTSLPSRPSV